MRHRFALPNFPSKNSRLRGLLALVLVLLATVGVSSAATEKILHSFHAWPHGFQPNGGLVSDAAGNLYGTVLYGGGHGFGSVYELTPNSQGGWTETLLYSFTGGVDGNGPTGPLLFDAAGNLYGATIGGGGAEGGTIFKLTRQANGQWMEKVLWNFHGEDGFNPNGALVFDPAGDLYGVTSSGGGLGERTCGQGGCGTAFRLKLEANGRWSQTILYRFQGQADGANPTANLVFDGHGNLYGTTAFGGVIHDNLGYGVVFEISQTSDGWRESVLHAFTNGADGATPGPVVFDGAGNLYGTTTDGGTGTGCFGFPCGTVFELSPAGTGQWTESVLHNFSGSDGDTPVGKVTFDQAGNLYGTTYYGGSEGWGTVFRLSPVSNGWWSETVLWNFRGAKDGARPLFGVLLGSAGQIYGATTIKGGAAGNGTVFELTSTGHRQWKETTLSNFADGSGDVPAVGPIFDTAGNLYGTTSHEGACGAGSVYQLTPASNGTWNENILYSFPAGVKFDPAPSNLIFDAAGNLYGETQYGGASGFGTIFELSRSGGSWTETDIYTFAGESDGANPQGGLILDQAGNLYGTTQTGGTSCERSGCGTVFELSHSGGGWKKTILYQFLGGATDGEDPTAGLIFDAAGNLYGTTLGGGIHGGNNCGIGCGGVFELSPSSRGWKESVLYFFTETHGDGAIPFGGLVVDAAGNLYGTTYSGGTQSEACGIGCGTVFEISPVNGGWKETVLYKFAQSGNPLASLVFDHAGNLYGTTPSLVFELSPVSGGGWSETTAYSFGDFGSGDGYYAEGSLIVDPGGNLYGTTAGGGSTGGGTVFEITP
jgi:uncharacterized repeat protein (TIGR03803 family)